jgi:hypothetical protein
MRHDFSKENSRLFVTNGVVEVDKTGLVELLQSNPDKESTDIDNQLIGMVIRSYDNMTAKQMDWILNKVQFIFRHNPRYREAGKIKDIRFLREGEYKERDFSTVGLDY